MSKTENAFVLIHFGSNPKYFELELYFCIMLKQNTSNNIIYMYSETDTPPTFVEAIKPYVYRTQGFNDNGITLNVSFESKYTSFNTLRTCDFIFAYLLEEYEKVCIIESDLVIMSNIDDIFLLDCPAILSYSVKNNQIARNNAISTNKAQILENCVEKSTLNGGVMLIKPDRRLYEEYVSAIKIIAHTGCKYPNEALFEYVNNIFYNLPVIYNLSHYKTLNLRDYGLRPGGEDIKIFHFNETDFKHLDIIKEGWLRANLNDPKVAEKYRVRKIPILFFEDRIYNPHKDEVNRILNSLSNQTPINANTTAVWTEYFSKTHNKPYWANKETGKKVWTKPVEEMASVPHPSAPPSKLKSDWVEKVSKTHNRPYWSNVVTGERVWEKPAELLGGKKRKRRTINKRKQRTNKRTANKRRKFRNQ